MRLRSLLLILGVFVIAFLLGILTSAQIRNKKIRDFKAYSTPEAFRVRFEKLLDPTPEQMKKIIPILDKYGKKNHDLRKEYQKQFIELMKQYRQELEPNLTREQIEKLTTRPWMRKDSRPAVPHDSMKPQEFYRRGPRPPKPHDSTGRDAMDPPAGESRWHNDSTYHGGPQDYPIPGGMFF